MEDELKNIFDELEKEAYDQVYHAYDVKKTNQIIRRNFERLFEAQTAKGGQAEVPVIPKIVDIIEDIQTVKDKFSRDAQDDGYQAYNEIIDFITQKYL